VGDWRAFDSRGKHLCIHGDVSNPQRSAAMMTAQGPVSS
jgi:hypothetical protein